MRNLYQILIDEHRDLVLTTKGKPEEATLPDLAKYIELEIGEINVIKARLESRIYMINKVKKKCDADIEVLKGDMDKIRRECKHRVTVFYPDTSGGNDSWTECTHCGASV